MGSPAASKLLYILQQSLYSVALRLNPKKNLLSLIQGTTFLGAQWDSTTVQATSSSACVETITIVTQKQRISSLVAPSVSHKGCMQVPLYPSSVEKTRIFGSGCPIEGMLPSKKYFDGHLTYRLGCGLRRSPAYGLWKILLGQ